MRLLNIFKKPKGPVTIFDVTKYIFLHKKIKKICVTPQRVRILLYYCYVWHLIWENEELFKDTPMATDMGVSFDSFKGIECHNKHNEFRTTIDTKGNHRRLKPHQIESIDSVIDHYGNKNFQWLKGLIIQEEPWKIASIKYITNDLIMDYYSKLERNLR